MLFSHFSSFDRISGVQSLRDGSHARKLPGNLARWPLLLYLEMIYLPGSFQETSPEVPPYFDRMMRFESSSFLNYH